MVKTKPDFMQRLCKSIKQLNTRIVIKAGDTIRFWRGTRQYCPITFVCRAETGLVFGINEYQTGARELGISLRAAQDLAFAADGSKVSGAKRKLLIKKLRTQMLATIRECQ